jgi:hypothetical protein
MIVIILSWPVWLIVAVVGAIVVTRSYRSGSPLRRSLRQPSFLLVTMMLLVAAVTLNGATRYMELYFKKLPLPLAKPVDTIPSKLGPWIQVSKDTPLEHELEEVLGTDKYIFRDYVDSTQVPKEQIDAFEGKSTDDRARLLANIQRDKPQAVIRLAVTYYTGSADTVAHIPDRCYVADGFEPSTYQIVNWEVFPDRPEGQRNIPARLINFEDQVGASTEFSTRNVAYFFHVNGHYESDPLGVRASLQNLRERYGYYAKVELMTLMRDKEKVAPVMRGFLVHALPEIEKCLPDWKKATSGESGNASAAAGTD